jgi:nucleolar pre-ribosomal-associated protein 1
MLYTMLYNSSDDEWKKERTWIVKFLADGMVGSEDWKILKRRHTWDLLASLFQSESDIGSAGLRAGILEVSSYEKQIFPHLNFCSAGIG